MQGILTFIAAVVGASVLTASGYINPDTVIWTASILFTLFLAYKRPEKRIRLLILSALLAAGMALYHFDSVQFYLVTYLLWVVPALALDIAICWKQKSTKNFPDLALALQRPQNIQEYQYTMDELLEAIVDGILTAKFTKIHHGLSVLQQLFSLRVPEHELKVLYPLDGLEMVQRRCLEEKWTLSNQKIFSTWIKIGLDLLTHQSKLCLFPITKASLGIEKALELGMDDLFIKGVLTLQEGAIQSLEQKKCLDFFRCNIQHISLLLKASYKNDKEQSIRSLMQPLVIIKQALKSYEQHPEYPLLLKAVDDALEEFLTLESVVMTMPNIETNENKHDSI